MGGKQYHFLVKLQICPNIFLYMNVYSQPRVYLAILENILYTYDQQQYIK